MAAKKNYVARQPIVHDGQFYPAGESLPLDDAAAAPLLAIGHIAKEEKPLAKTDEPKTDESGKVA